MKENTMNLENEIEQVGHEEYVRLWAEKLAELKGCNKMMKLLLAFPEPDYWEAMSILGQTNKILSFGGAIPSELIWKNFAGAMPKLAKEVKENYDKLEAKVSEMGISPIPRWISEEREEEIRKAKLPWYKRWFA